MEVVGSSPIDPTSTVGLVTRHQTIGSSGRFFIASSGGVLVCITRGTRIVAQALLAIPDAPPACFAHWARQAPVPPAKCELVATLDAASDKEAVFLYIVWFLKAGMNLCSKVRSRFFLALELHWGTLKSR